ncbi:MAG: ABC transporter permease [Actinomycetota bacterium]|nr:ABC transporter permease [Actinomycetota bacterium]
MTLWILTVLVFVGAQILPGDVGRRILGRDASPEAVAALNEELGTDRPIPVQYADWVGGLVQGDLGESFSLRVPVSDLVFDALANSFKLALVAFVIVVPLGIVGGVYAALREGRFADRFITVSGLTATVVPEFVSSIILILVFGLWLELLPITAAWPEGAGPLTQLEHLILPSLPLVLVLFGYIARMARAGTIEALDADYTRTAVLKGLPQRLVVRRHVLRNALLPTIAVVATQTGYLIGGLVVIEVIFNYQGIGRLLFQAVQAKDFPLLQSAILLVGVIYLLATLLADLAYSLLNPRIRYAQT